MELDFLTRDDLESRIFEDYIDESEQEDIEALQSIESQAIALVKSKLAKRYDVAIIFSDAPYTGRGLIIWAMSAIVIYRLIRRNAARKVPTDFKDDYKEVMQWLDDVRDGNENPNLPKIEEPEQKQVLWGNSTNLDKYI